MHLILFCSNFCILFVQFRIRHLARFSTAQVVDEEFSVWVSRVRSSLRRDSRREQGQSGRSVSVAARKSLKLNLGRGVKVWLEQGNLGESLFIGTLFDTNRQFSPVYKVDIVSSVRQGSNCALDGVDPRLMEKPKPG